MPDDANFSESFKAAAHDISRKMNASLASFDSLRQAEQVIKDIEKRAESEKRQAIIDTAENTKSIKQDVKNVSVSLDTEIRDRKIADKENREYTDKQNKRSYRLGLVGTVFGAIGTIFGVVGTVVALISFFGH